MKQPLNSHQYAELEYLNVEDNIVCNYQYEACNLFGHQYEGWLKAIAKHPNEDDKEIWFPKLYSNEGWNNEISFDGNTIFTKNDDTKKLLAEQLEYKTELFIVFAHVIDSDGNYVYRFFGLYKFSKALSSVGKGVAFKRISTSVKTYFSNKDNTL